MTAEQPGASCRLDGPEARRAIADFHVHTNLSRDATMTPHEVVHYSIGRGLTHVAVCDHGTIEGALAARDVAESLAAEIIIVVGEEIRSSEGEIIGLFLAEHVPDGLTLEETVSAIKAQGGLVYVPHPFDHLRRSPLAHDALERIAERVDLVEGFNSRNFLHADNAAAAEWAQRHDVPLVAGSDAHTSDEIGNVRVEMPYFDDAETLAMAARHANVRGFGSGLRPHVVTAVTKRVPGRQHGLG